MMSRKVFSHLVLLVLIISTCVVLVNAAEDKKSSSSSSSSSDKKQTASSKKGATFSSSWLPKWLPNIHRLSKEACSSISTFRTKSKIVTQMIKRNQEENKKGSGAQDVSEQKLSDKIQRAAGSKTQQLKDDAPGVLSSLRQNMGYDWARLGGNIPAQRAHGTPRLLCLGFSHMEGKGDGEQGLSRMYHAWARHCEHTLLYTKLKTIERVPQEHVREIHPILGDGSNNIWQKIRLALSMLSDPTQDGKILQDSDFVIFFTDDSFFSVTNAKAMLMEPYIVSANRMNSLLLLGHRMNDRLNVFVSNLGYILNRQLVRVLADLVNTPACDPMAMSGSDDIQMGKCLGVFGVTPFDTYDELGEDRMVMWDPDMMAYSIKNGFPEWYVRYRRPREVPKALSIMSQHPLAFHGINNPHKVDRLRDLVG